MKKHSIINSIILGGSLMVSIGVISLASINAADPGNNSGVYKPINEGPSPQTKQSTLRIENGDLELSGRLSDIGGGNRGGYYLDPDVTSRLFGIDLLGPSTLDRTNAQINENDLSLVNKRYVDNNFVKKTDFNPSEGSFFTFGTGRVDRRMVLFVKESFFYVRYEAVCLFDSIDCYGRNDKNLFRIVRCLFGAIGCYGHNVYKENRLSDMLRNDDDCSNYFVTDDDDLSRLYESFSDKRGGAGQDITSLRASLREEFSEKCEIIRTSFREKYGSYDDNPGNYSINDGRVSTPPLLPNRLDNLISGSKRGFSRKLAPINTHVCNLNSISGDMAGGGEYAKIYPSYTEGVWRFDFSTKNSTFDATGVCYQFRESEI